MRVQRAILVAFGVAVIGVGVWAVRLTRQPPPSSLPARTRAPDAHVVGPSRPDPEPSPSPSAPGSGSGSARAPSPSPSGPEPLQIQRDPRHPDYDAAKLFGAQGGDVLDFFAAEPRDPAWAPEREEDLKDITLPRMREVDPDAKIDVECHTGTCRMRVHSHDKALTQQMDSYPLTCLANTAVPMWGPNEGSGSGSGSGSNAGSNTDVYSDFDLIFGQETRDRGGMLAANEGRCAKYREEFFKNLARQPAK